MVGGLGDRQDLDFLKSLAAVLVVELGLIAPSRWNCLLT